MVPRRSSPPEEGAAVRSIGDRAAAAASAGRPPPRAPPSLLSPPLPAPPAAPPSISRAMGWSSRCCRSLASSRSRRAFSRAASRSARFSARSLAAFSRLASRAAAALAPISCRYRDCGWFSGAGVAGLRPGLSVSFAFFCHMPRMSAKFSSFRRLRMPPQGPSRSGLSLDESPSPWLPR